MSGNGPDVVRKVVELLEARHGPVRVDEPVASVSVGFDSDIHFVHLAGDGLPTELARPLVLRVKADVHRFDEAVREERIQGWVADRGFPTPRVLEVFAPGVVAAGPVQLMERASGVSGLDRLRTAPWGTRRLMRELAALQARLHTLEPAGFPAGADLLAARLRLTRHVDERIGNETLRSGLARIEALTDELLDSEPSVCHGDYHPLNAVVDGDRISIIDWTDAGVGDRHGDVARTLVLFRVASIAAENAAERVALRVIGPRLARGYRRHYERHLPLDDRRLALWTPVHLLHGLAQVVAVQGGVFDSDREDDDRAERLPPALGDQLAAQLGVALDEIGA